MIVSVVYIRYFFFFNSQFFDRIFLISLCTFRLRKRPVYGLRFDYQSDFDQNGVIYWVATRGKGWDTHWANPHITGEIRV
jgi:hypothetical protein